MAAQQHVHGITLQCCNFTHAERSVICCSGVPMAVRLHCMLSTSALGSMGVMLLRTLYEKSVQMISKQAVVNLRKAFMFGARPLRQVRVACSCAASRVPSCVHDTDAEPCVQILSVVYGQELPSPDASIGYQVFGVAVATTGLATFALVLALLQQVVLEVIDENVKQGRRVYEEKHVRTLKPAKAPAKSPSP